MNILVLMLRANRLEYTIYEASSREPLLDTQIIDMSLGENNVQYALEKIRDRCALLYIKIPEQLVIRSPYGGEIFTRTTIVDEAMLTEFASLSHEAPVHVGSVCQLARAALRVYASATVAMAFETAFFVDLPERERRYGISDGHFRRFGYHGLYHEMATMFSGCRQGAKAARTLSLCLEPQPEMAAIIGHTPVMVTSGATPLEGLPGEGNCGELDPTIVLTLARKMKWGPEKINNVLSRRSGLSGLCQRPMKLGQLLATHSWKLRQALTDDRDGDLLDSAIRILAYRILLAAGAGIAAMGGVDQIVMTGRYCEQSYGLGQWLSEMLVPRNSQTSRPSFRCCNVNLARIMADHMIRFTGNQNLCCS